MATKRPYTSATKGVQYDVEPPSEAIIEHWKPIIEILYGLIVDAPSTSINRSAFRPRISLTLPPNKYKMPKEWPKGELLIAKEDGSRVVSFDANKVLLWLWKMKIAEYNPSMLYKSRGNILRDLECFGNYVDV